MRYSVWNVGKSTFDYYEDARVNPSQNTPKPGHLVNRALGSTVDQAAWPLPADARPIGSGDVAIGRVASRGSSSSALGDVLSQSPLVKAGLLLAAAILAYKYVLPKHRRAR
jgi:hypothetical protein